MRPPPSGTLTDTLVQTAHRSPRHHPTRDLLVAAPAASASLLVLPAVSQMYQSRLEMMTRVAPSALQSEKTTDQPHQGAQPPEGHYTLSQVCVFTQCVSLCFWDTVFLGHCVFWDTVFLGHCVSVFVSLSVLPAVGVLCHQAVVAPCLGRIRRAQQGQLLHHRHCIAGL